MDNKITIKSKLYDMPAVFCQPDVDKLVPAVILCHGTGSCKDEIGNLFIRLAKFLSNAKSINV